MTNQPTKLNNEIFNTVRTAHYTISNVYDLQDQEQKLRNEAQKQRIIANDIKSRHKKEADIAGLVFGIIAFIVFEIILLVVSNREQEYYNYFGKYDELVHGFVCLLSFAILLIFRGLFLLIPYKKQCRPHIEKAEESEEKADYLREQIDLIIDANVQSISFIPCEYRFPEATGFIIRAFELGRATTLSEAYDKLEEQLHRWKMEKSMNTLINMQIAQLDILQKISYDTDWI